MATVNNVNDGIYASTKALPLNAKTSVRFEAVGRDLLLFLNNTLDSVATVSGDRYGGAATVYVSDPWHPSASARIASIKMSAITALTSTPVSAVNGPLSYGIAYEKTTVPADYALSFDITPTGTVEGWASIIHYTGDGSNVDKLGRIPGMTDLQWLWRVI